MLLICILFSHAFFPTPSLTGGKNRGDTNDVVDNDNNQLRYVTNHVA